MPFTDFFHRLFNPHCEICALADRERLEREEDAKICKECEFLKTELAKERNRSQQLLDSILVVQQQNVETAQAPMPQPFMPFKPWRLRQRELEEASRQAATEKREAKSVEELEKELLNE